MTSFSSKTETGFLIVKVLLKTHLAITEPPSLTRMTQHSYVLTCFTYFVTFRNLPKSAMQELGIAVGTLEAC